MNKNENKLLSSGYKMISIKSSKVKPGFRIFYLVFIQEFLLTCHKLFSLKMKQQTKNQGKVLQSTSQSIISFIYSYRVSAPIFGHTGMLSKFKVFIKRLYKFYMI